MKLLREYIRVLLTEAAKGPGDLPDNVVVAIIDQGEHRKFVYMLEKEGPYGTTKMEKASSKNAGLHGMVSLMKPEYPCGGAWEVLWSKAEHGWGPMLYDVAMEWASQNGGGLVSDRNAVSAAAESVWDYYLSNRSDVQSAQLDDLQNTITPEEEDNCEQNAASEGDYSTKYQPIDFRKSPLSKRYTKSPTTINALEAAGKLVLM